MTASRHLAFCIAVALALAFATACAAPSDLA